MWAFLPGGLLMPAALPTKARDGVVVAKKWTHDGKFDLQVRARVESHLTNFLRDYMDPMKLEHSGIQATPRMDYDFRFYCTKADFAQALAAAALDIDYLKFKPTAERRTADGKYLMYEDGKEYHSTLNSIWGVVARLGRPYGGSAWASGGGWSSKRNSTQASKRSSASTQRQIDSIDGDLFLGEVEADPLDSVPDFVPGSDLAMSELFDQLSDIPHAQWGEHAVPEELESLESWMVRNNLADQFHVDSSTTLPVSIEVEPGA